MRKKRSNGGFTLAELLIVVAIIGVLSGVAFIAVQNHEKSMTQLERDTIAKEIFIAAQNHLTVAKTQNYNNDLDEDNNTAAYKAFFGESITYTTKETVTKEDGTQEEKEVTASGVHYMVGGKDETNTGNALELMLPFGSIDDTIRMGGNYIIVYQPKAGVVLDVFYWETSGKYGGTVSDYPTVIGLRGDENKGSRLDNKPMLGWFGGEGAVETGVFLKTPSIEVINAEKLIVKVTDKNVGNTAISDMEPMLKLILTGKSSKAMMAFTLVKLSGTPTNWMGALDKPDTFTGVTRLLQKTVNGTEVTYEIVLDDITSKDMEFSQLNKTDGVETKDDIMAVTWLDTTRFTPGEDIIIQAVAYSNKAFSSVAYSGEWTTNSLFGGLREETDEETDKETDKKKVALISNIRHLENLNEKVSALNNSSSAVFTSAEQTTDLDWNDFKTQIGNNDLSIYSYDTVEDVDYVYSTKPGCYLPVSPSYPLTYKGQSVVKNEAGAVVSAANHKVANIAVDDTGTYSLPTGITAAPIPAGGMFGALVAGSSVSNLELKDFSINLTSGDAGALAGTITDTTISNVVARNSGGATTVYISAPGAVGGLIGSMTASEDTYKVEKSAAALIVSSSGGNAGGLIGTTSGGTVTACYSGGHTTEGKYTGTYDEATKSVANFNVTASNGIAGGLIGTAGTSSATIISNSYSTCSAAGEMAGGFAGTASNGSITNCYSTGLVRGKGEDTLTGTETKVPKDGAFAYSLASGVTVDSCKYFEIINEREDDAKGFDYLTALGNKGTPTGITAFDATAASYNDFVGSPEPVNGEGGWKNAAVYDDKLTDYYGTGSGDDRVSRYNLKTVEQLGATLKVDSTDSTDYFVATHYGDWPAPEIFVLNTPAS